MDSAAEKVGPYNVLSVGSSAWTIEGPGKRWAHFAIERQANDICRYLNRGYAAGRASRDGLRDALVKINGECGLRWNYEDIDKYIVEILAIDDGGKA